MFGLSEADRELDEGIIPLPIKLLAVVVFVSVPIYFLGFAGPERASRNVVPNDVAFGCYSHPSLPDFAVNESGLAVPEQNVGPIEFYVKAGGGGRAAYLELAKPIVAVRTDGVLQVRASEGRGAWRLNARTAGGGTYMPGVNDDPISGLRLLNRDGESFLLRRTHLTDCQSLPLP